MCKQCPNKKCGVFYSEIILPKKWLKEYNFCPFCGTKLEEV